MRHAASLLGTLISSPSSLPCTNLAFQFWHQATLSYIHLIKLPSCLRTCGPSIADSLQTCRPPPNPSLGLHCPSSPKARPQSSSGPQFLPPSSQTPPPSPSPSTPASPSPLHRLPFCAPSSTPPPGRAGIPSSLRPRSTPAGLPFPPLPDQRTSLGSALNSPCVST